MGLKQEILVPIDEREIEANIIKLQELKSRLEWSYFWSWAKNLSRRIQMDILSILTLPTWVWMQSAFEVIKSTERRVLETLDSSLMDLFLNSWYIMSTIWFIWVIQRLKILYNDYFIKKEVEKLETEERIRASRTLLDWIERPRSLLE
jgi:hypothetical protein